LHLIAAAALGFDKTFLLTAVLTGARMGELTALTRTGSTRARTVGTMSTVAGAVFCDSGAALETVSGKGLRDGGGR
jgi:hypothetical protein